MTNRPIPDSYWVKGTQLLAGEYPRTPTETSSRQKLRAFLDAGIDTFIDLTESGEHGLAPYADMLAALAAERAQSITYQRLPITDVSVPTASRMREILDAIDAELAAGKTVYVHCFGGIGRTGTVVGCYQVRHGLPPAEALANISRWRANTPDGHRASPETQAQVKFVKNWETGR